MLNTVADNPEANLIVAAQLLIMFSHRTFVSRRFLFLNESVPHLFDRSAFDYALVCCQRGLIARLDMGGHNNRLDILSAI